MSSHKIQSSGATGLSFQLADWNHHAKCVDNLNFKPLQLKTLMC